MSEIIYDIELQEETINFTFDNIHYVNSGGNYICETLEGEINGVNTVFNTSYNYEVNTTRVYINGLLQRRGVDYNELGVRTIEFTDAPSARGFTDNLIVIYKIKEI